jgi:hypothetical protein
MVINVLSSLVAGFARRAWIVDELVRLYPGKRSFACTSGILNEMAETVMKTGCIEQPWVIRIFPVRIALSGRVNVC